MILNLIKLAKDLDILGYTKESIIIDGLIKEAQNKIILIKLYGRIIMKKYIITISTVDDTTKVGNAKSFKGSQEQVGLAKQYLQQLIQKYPQVKIDHDLSSTLTPQMFGIK